MKLQRFTFGKTGGSAASAAGWRGWISVAIPLAALACMAVMAFAGAVGPPWTVGLSWNPVPASVELLGFSGHAGEWELAATVTRKGETRELSGPVKITHVGWCSQSGPEVKTGEVVVTMARLTSDIAVRLRVDGGECTFQSRLTDVYAGTLHCPDKRPAPLSLWLR